MPRAASSHVGAEMGYKREHVLDDTGRARVAPHVSSLTDPIYVVIGLPEETSARLLAATSGGDLREEIARRGAEGAGGGAEHAAVHLVIEGASRLAASRLSDLRPGACTLRSGPIDRHSYVEPAGLPKELATIYRDGVERLLGTYLDLLPRVVEALRARTTRAPRSPRPRTARGSTITPPGCSAGSCPSPSARASR